MSNLITPENGTIKCLDSEVRLWVQSQALSGTNWVVLGSHIFKLFFLIFGSQFTLNTILPPFQMYSSIRKTTHFSERPPHCSVHIYLGIIDYMPCATTLLSVANLQLPACTARSPHLFTHPQEPRPLTAVSLSSVSNLTSYASYSHL